MNEYVMTVEFVIKAQDEKHASNILHVWLARSDAPDEIDWRFTLNATNPAARNEPCTICGQRAVGKRALDGAKCIDHQPIF